MRLRVDLLASSCILDLWVRYAYTIFSKVINIAICFFWWSSREWLLLHMRMQSLNCWKTSESDPIYIVSNFHRIDLKVVRISSLDLLRPNLPCLCRLWEGGHDIFITKSISSTSLISFTLGCWIEWNMRIS